MRLQWSYYQYKKNRRLTVALMRCRDRTIIFGNAIRFATKTTNKLFPPK